MSELRLIGAPAGVQRAWLFDRIAQSRAARRPVVLFVPEQYTLQAERDLLTGMKLPGLLNLDVVSPTRLRSLVRERAGFSGRAALDDAGRAMAVHQALQDCASSLTCYQHLGSLYGAVSRVDRTLSEMREENLDPDFLEALAENSRGARGAKYRDLSVIWRACDALMEGRFDDPADSWRDTCARLAASGLWQGRDLYVYGFDTVRPDLRELICAAAGVCASVRVLLTMVPSSSPSGRIYQVQRESALQLLTLLEERGIPCTLEYLSPAPPRPGDALAFLSSHVFSDAPEVFSGNPDPAVTVYSAPHPTAEALAIVSTLLRWHGEGISWNRMAVALPGSVSAPEPLLAALKRHRIPFFFSRREPLNRHGVSQLLSSALICVSQGLETEPLLKIACCGFGTLTREEGDRLAAYAQTWGIERSRWRKPFSRGEDADAAEKLRLRLLAPLDRLHRALREARTTGECAERVFDFLQEEGIHAQLLARRDRLLEAGRYAEAAVDRQVWDLLMGLLDQLHALLGPHRATLKEISLLLRGALERATLAPIPEEEEGVAVGRIGHMLPGQVDALILPGMNDGVMKTRLDSLLSDAERRAMEQRAGRALGLSQVRMNRVVRSDYARTLSLPEKRLWVSYCLRDEGGGALLPGEPVSELRRLFPDLRERGGLSEEASPGLPGTPALALEAFSPLLQELTSGMRDSLPPEWEKALRGLLQEESVLPVLEAMLAPLSGPSGPREIAPDTALRLFHGEKVSISRLECYAACPWQHFLRYGLRPRLPRSFEFTSGDAGNFFHAALQQYVNRAVLEPGWPRLEEDRVRMLMDDVLEELVLPWEDGPLREDALGRWQGAEYLRRARHAASVLTRFAANGDSRVLGTEIEFGVPGGLPPLVLRLPDSTEVALQGKIDRLDLFRGPDGDYLRVMDLKSSEHRLDPARMETGEQLQLMIYLQAALRGWPGSLPAGAVYFPVLDREVSAPTPEAAESLRLRDVQLRGVVLLEENVLHAMDRDVSPFSLPKIFNQNGTLAKSADWVLPAPVLQNLMDAALRRAADICLRIRSGQVPVSPSGTEDRKPCSFCDFRSICPVRKGDLRPLPEGITFAEVGRTGI